MGKAIKRKPWHMRWLTRESWSLHEFAMICINANPERPVPVSKRAAYADAVEKIKEGVRSGELKMDLESMEIPNRG